MSDRNGNGERGASGERGEILFKALCPNCQAKIKIRDANLIGSRVTCPGCKTQFVVEAPPTAQIVDLREAPAVSRPTSERGAVRQSPPIQSNQSTGSSASKSNLNAGKSQPSARGTTASEARARKPPEMRPDPNSPIPAIPVPPKKPKPAPAPARPLALGSLPVTQPMPPAAPPPSRPAWLMPVVAGGITLFLGVNVLLAIFLAHNLKFGGASQTAAQNSATTSDAVAPAPASAPTPSPATSFPVPATSIPAPPEIAAAPVENPIVSSPPNRQTQAASSSASATAPPRGATREILDRVGGGIVLISTYDESGGKTGLGSGFVIDSTGKVATNFHVIESATKAVAQFKDGTESEILGYWIADKAHDLAVLQLKQSPPTMAVLNLAADADPQQGDDVIAIGHPKGFSFSVSTGIVSAVRKPDDLPEETRQWLEPAADSKWIQTTAPISPGNSGGPLLNSRGVVIGINTWVSLGGENLAFATHVQLLAADVGQISGNWKSLPVPGGKPAVNSLVAEVTRAFETEYQQHVNQIREAGIVARGRLEAQSPVPKFMERFYQLADQHRREPLALEALVAVCDLSVLDKHQGGKPILTKSIDRLYEDHLADERMADVAIHMIRMQPDPCVDFLSKVAANSPHHEVKGIALFTLAIQKGAQANGNRNDEKKAIGMLERVNREYADVQLGETTLGAIVGPMIFEIENLAIGKRFPDIQGDDFDGKHLKLTSFRGRVVVVDFFTDASETCRALYPEQQAIATRFQNEGLQLLSVNVDPFDQGRQVVDLKKVTWPVIADGPKGPITQRFHLQSYPRNFVLDPQGQIRFRDVHGEDLVRAIDVLLSEMNPNRQSALAAGASPPPQSANPQIGSRFPSHFSRSRGGRGLPSTRFGPRYGPRAGNNN